MERASRVSESASHRSRPAAGGSRLEGKICSRCGRILTVAERLIGEIIPPAVCRECTLEELAELGLELGPSGLVRSVRPKLVLGAAR